MSIPIDSVVPSPSAQETATDIVAIINPSSGKGSEEGLEARIAYYFARRGRQVTFLTTGQEIGADILAQQAVERKAKLVLLCGGDGTVSRGLAGLSRSGVPAALLPIGTGNLLAINLGITGTGTLTDYLDIALQGEPQPLDLVHIRDDRGNEYYSSVMAGVGNDARMVAGAKPVLKRRWGIWAYLYSAMRNTLPRSSRMWLTADGESPVRYRTTSVILANVGRVQGGVQLVPEGHHADGLVDIAIVKASTWPGWIRVLLSVLLRRLREEPGVELIYLSKGRMRFARPQPFQYDGEAMPVLRELEFEVLQGAVQVMLPPAVAAQGRK